MLESTHTERLLHPGRLKKLVMTNTLAYFAGAVLTKKNVAKNRSLVFNHFWSIRCYSIQYNNIEFNGTQLDDSQHNGCSTKHNFYAIQISEFLLIHRALQCRMSL